MAGQGTVTVAILGDAKSLKSALNDSDTAIGKFSDKMKSAGKSITAIGATMTAGVTLPIVGIGAAAFTMASDLNESVSKVQVVFGEFAKGTIEWAQSAATSLGMSTQAALEAAGTFGNFLQSMGLAKPAAVGMSEALVELASDLASFNNANPEDVLLALRSGLSGEAEPMRKFGVALSETAVNAKAAEMGLTGVNGELTEGEKIQARFAIIMDQTAMAQGDFARTADGAANKQRILKAEFENTAAVIGQKLMPVGMTLLGWVAQLATAFTNLSPHMQDVVLIGAALAAAIGPLTTIIGGLVTGIGALISPVALIVLGIGALIAAVVYAYTECEWFRDVVDTLIEVAISFGGTLKDFLTPIIEFITAHTDEFRIAAIALGVVVGGVLLVAITAIGVQIAALIVTVTLVVAAVLGFVDILQWLWEKSEGVRNVLGEIASVITGQLVQAFQAWWDIASSVASFIGDTFRPAIDAGRAAIDALRGAFDVLFSAVQNVIDKVHELIGLIPTIPGIPGIGGGGSVGGGKYLPDTKDHKQTRDAGGPVTAGMSYMIGLNRKPEIFTPGASGFVTPLSASGGGNVFHITGSKQDADAIATAVRQVLLRTGKRNGRNPLDLD